LVFGFGFGFDLILYFWFWLCFDGAERAAAPGDRPGDTDQLERTHRPAVN
jgi:hypothetical protein